MASKTITTLTDDLDESITEDVNTVKFGLHGTFYEVDLGSKHQQDLEAALEQFVAVARKVSGSAPVTRRSSSSSAGSSDAKQIRAWAAQNNVEVPPRGRIPNDIREQYEAAAK